MPSRSLLSSERLSKLKSCNIKEIRQMPYACFSSQISFLELVKLTVNYVSISDASGEDLYALKSSK
jgi:hypothetical protein